MSNVLVYIQEEDGHLHDVSLQALVAARPAAEAAGGLVCALILGEAVAAHAPALIAAGADKVLSGESPLLAQYLTTPYLQTVRQALAGGDYSLALFPASTEGNDLAPMVAAAEKAACVIDADALALTDGAVHLLRTEFDRKVQTAYAATGDGLLVASVTDGVAASSSDANRSGETLALEVTIDEGAIKSRIVSRDVVQKTVNLKEARIIVAVGAGVGSKESFETVKDLAGKLDAQLGATRAVVDAGWLPADHQIGQTGAVVRPDVYIGVGISGAVQHWVGMLDSKCIIAINNDKNCPLMKKAHYRVEGDLNSVVPKLIKLLA